VQEDKKKIFLEKLRKTQTRESEISAEALSSAPPSKLSTALAKVELLNELNKLVSSAAGVDRISRTLAREAAFRFKASCALAMVLSPANDSLLIRGCYGCNSTDLPEQIEFEGTQLGTLLSLGGIIAIPELKLTDESGLSFLIGLGVHSVQLSTIETQGQKLGLLVIGFNSFRSFSDEETSMLEEFTRGAAVAVLTAKTQQKLSTYAEHLEELVQQRTADLAIQTSRADEANRAKSEFVANISHELRTPLTAIVGYSSICCDGLLGDLTPQQRDAVSAINRAADHLRSLIDDILNMSKIEAGKEEVKPNRVAIKELFEQLYKLMQQSAMSKGVKLHQPKVLEEENFTLWVDNRHIRQILINLLSNATKYTPEGGEVRIAADLVGDKVRISVTDTGIGISEEQKEKLFARYKRLDDDYAKAQVGTGIGLSLTKHLVEINGGMIGVESEIGKGSTFWVLIPKAEQTSLLNDVTLKPAAESAPVPINRLDGLDILIVDDNQATCDVLKALIEAVGGKVCICPSVSDAKTQLNRNKFDSALIDLAMPIESGWELIEWMRSNRNDAVKNLPIIVVSACVFNRASEQKQHPEIAEFVTKPFNPSQIVDTIRTTQVNSVMKSSSRWRVIS
jgi:signal transduction histidine kinase/ActR/RegA family two-component response regulator